MTETAAWGKVDIAGNLVDLEVTVNAAAFLALQLHADIHRGLAFTHALRAGEEEVEGTRKTSGKIHKGRLTHFNKTGQGKESENEIVTSRLREEKHDGVED